MLAYILISVEKGTEHDIFEEIQSMDECLGINVIFGEWDLITKVKIENAEALGTFILDKIRPLSGVSLTSALIVAK